MLREENTPVQSISRVEKALDRTQPEIREKKPNYAKPVGVKGEK